jgi:hypothetical protein
VPIRGVHWIIRTGWQGWAANRHRIHGGRVNGVDELGRGQRPASTPQFPAALIVVYCLPTVLIAGGLIVAGGTRLGLLMPAIAIGAMIGGMLFLGRLERRD